MIYRLRLLLLPLVAVMALLTVAASVLAAPAPVALRVFYSSNLQGELSPCG